MVSIWVEGAGLLETYRVQIVPCSMCAGLVGRVMLWVDSDPDEDLQYSSRSV